MRWFQRPLVCLFLLMALGGQALAASPPKVLLLFVSGISYADLTESGPLAKLRSLAEEGSIGLLHVAVVGEPTEAATLLSIGAGVPLAVPDRTGPKYREAGIERTAADIATDVFRADTREGSVVCRTYRKRFGEYPPLRADLVHIGVLTLRHVQKNAAAADRIGELGEVLHRAGRRVTTLGEWQSVLVGMDKRAAVYKGALRPLLLHEVGKQLRTCDLLIYAEPNPRRFASFVPVLKKLMVQGDTTTMIICLPGPTAGPTSQPFFIGLGPRFPMGALVTSLSTRRAGWVEAIDIAPTIAGFCGAAFHGPGHPITTVTLSGKNWDLLQSGLWWDHVLHRWGVLIGGGFAILLGLPLVYFLTRFRSLRER